MLQKKRDDKRLEKKVGKWFKYQGRVIAKALPKMRRHFIESAESDFNAMFDSAIKVTVSSGEEIFKDGLVNGVGQGYTALQEDLGLQAAFSLDNPAAVEWSRTQAAVDVANVNDTTKGTIRSIVTNGLEKGLSYDEVARQISKRFTQFAVGMPQQHIQSRAHLVAINENAIAYAHGETTLIGDIEAAGVDMEKSWHTVGDERVSKGCQQNAAGGWIPESEAFASGAMMYPRFPGCRCNVHHRVARSKAEHEKERQTVQQELEKTKDKNIRTAEDRIRNNSTETGIAFDKNGKKVLEKKGISDRVIYTDSEIKRMEGSILTHNHPMNVGFSSEDLEFLVQNNLSEIRAVTSTGQVFSMKMPPGGLKYGAANLTPAQQVSEARAYIRFEAGTVKRRIKKQIRSGDITVARANATGWDEISRDVARRLNLEYTVTNL